MIVTNNEDFYQYLQNRGVVCIYAPKPMTHYSNDDLVVVFTNDYHSLSVCGNRFQNNKKHEFVREANELMDWFERSDRVIMISNIIKLGTPYMRNNFELLQQRYDKLGITKQVIHGKTIGELINPNKKQIRYKNVEPIEWDIMNTNMYDPKYIWKNKHGKIKQMQQCYINILNATRNTDERRKMRYIPYYVVFSQLYKQLKKRGDI